MGEIYGQDEVGSDDYDLDGNVVGQMPNRVDFKRFHYDSYFEVEGGKTVKNYVDEGESYR